MSKSLEMLAAKPVTRSVVEEAIGIMWALLASLTPFKIIAIFAWSMAAISLSAAIYFALRAHKLSNGGRNA